MTKLLSTMKPPSKDPGGSGMEVLSQLCEGGHTRRS
jgi:hypothetical protein